MASDRFRSPGEPSASSWPLGANRVVTIDEISEDIWQLSPPRSARASLHNTVMRLRQALGAEAGRVATLAAGYQLTVHPGEFDIASFEQLSRSGRDAARRGDWAEAARLQEAALVLWRGRPFADVPSDRMALREGHRLQELLIAALEARAEAAIKTCRPGQAIADLTRLTREEPLRERSHALLMLALWQDGRRASALAAYQAARAALLDHGLDPGPELQRLQLRILREDSQSEHAFAVLPAWPRPGPVFIQ
jgi:DNA-binding SARP family transcriptional activator